MKEDKKMVALAALVAVFMALGVVELSSTQDKPDDEMAMISAR